MRLTAYTDYALRVLIYVGLKPGQASTIGDIAQAYGISRNHLVKIVHRLSTLGYLESVRGKGGGIRLGMPPERINIGAVVRDTEPDMALVECLQRSGGECRITSVCALQHALHEALGAFMGTLGRYTLADLLRPNRRLSRLLAVDEVIRGQGPKAESVGDQSAMTARRVAVRS